MFWPLKNGHFTTYRGKGVSIFSSECNPFFFSPDASDDKKATKIYNGLTSCVSDHHVHVECNEEVVGHLIEMAEPELSGLRQERHAKTIEIAQKEVLTCIGKV